MSASLLRAVGGVLTLVLIAAIVWAGLNANFFAGVAHVTANPWGVVTLVDLYIGFVLLGLIVVWLEGGRAWAWALLPLSFVLGNVVYGVWAVLRAGHHIGRRAS